MLSRVLLCFSAKHGFDEGGNVAVHDILDVAGFVTGPEIFDHLVGLENVGADLAAPTDFAFLRVGAVGFGFLFVFLDLVELGTK